jgi:hypothetical protein
MSRPRDVQKRRVYRWEGALPRGACLTLEEVAAFIEDIWMLEWENFGAKAVIPRIVLPSARRVPVFWAAVRDRGGFMRPGKVLQWSDELAQPRQATASRFAWELCLPSWAWRQPIILHELAHLLDTRSALDRAGHDARFVAILIYLRARYLGECPLALRRAAHAAGVKADRIERP